MSTVKNSPSDAIPAVGQRPKDDCEISSIVGREECRNVLEDDKFGATLLNEACKVIEESGLASFEPTPWSHSCEADVLTREAAGPNLRFGYVIRVYLRNVFRTWHIGPVLLKDVETEGLLLALPDRLHARVLEAQVKASDAREEAGNPEPPRWNRALRDTKASDEG